MGSQLLELRVPQIGIARFADDVEMEEEKDGGWEGEEAGRTTHFCRRTALGRSTSSPADADAARSQHPASFQPAPEWHRQQRLSIAPRREESEDRDITIGEEPPSSSAFQQRRQQVLALGRRTRRRSRTTSVSEAAETPSAHAGKAVAVLLLALMVSGSTVHSFVAFDRSSSCVRAFGCAEDLVGFLLEIESAEMCLQMCDANPMCNYFTWRSGMEEVGAAAPPDIGGEEGPGMFHNFCFLHNRCESLDFTCRDCYSGPRSEHCPFSRRNM